MDTDWSKILVCPQCRAPVSVHPDKTWIICTNESCALQYPIKDDIPVMIIEEARKTTP